MQDPTSFAEGLVQRALGPLSLRLFVQPAIALYFGIRDGRRDAHQGRPPYFWSLFTDPDHRREMVGSGWRSIGKVFFLAVVLDLIFQHLQFSRIHWLGALIAGLALALFPYLLLRGPVNRWSSSRGSTPARDAEHGAES